MFTYLIVILVVGDALILFHLAEVGWQITCLALEELDEIGRIVVAEFVGNLLYHQTRIAHHTLGFKDDAVVDECQRRLLRTFVDTFVQRADGYVQAIGILLYGVKAHKLLIHHSAKLHEELVRGLEVVEVYRVLLLPMALNLYEEDVQK